MWQRMQFVLWLLLPEWPLFALRSVEALWHFAQISVLCMFAPAVLESTPCSNGVEKFGSIIQAALDPWGPCAWVLALPPVWQSEHVICDDVVRPLMAPAGAPVSVAVQKTLTVGHAQVVLVPLTVKEVFGQVLVPSTLWPEEFAGLKSRARSVRV